MRLAVARRATMDGPTVRTRSAPAAARGPAAALLGLQRAVGNRATARAIQLCRDGHT